VAQFTDGTASDRTFYRHGALEMVPAAVELTRLPGEHAVTVHAKQYVHAVELDGDAVFEDSCFSLLPGESRKIAFRAQGNTEITATAYTILK
jgi:hypothetical protein